MLRAKGFVWLASKHDTIGVFSLAGNCVSVEPLHDWYAALPGDQWPEDEESLAALKQQWQEPFGDRQQELVLIGQQMDEHAIRSALNDALLTDEEMTFSVEEWLRLPDPFGSWAAELVEVVD